MYKRIIARLDIKNNTLVKGVSLEGLRVLGDPQYFSKQYFKNGIDEIHFQDVVATLYNRNSLDEVIESTVKNVFVTISAGGAIRNIEDINKVLRLGADKVTINSAAVRNPEFIKEASEEYGSSTIAVSIETILSDDNNYYVLIESGREKTNVELFSFIEKIQKLGAGEIILTSIQHEGRRKGFNIDLYKKIKKLISVPLVSHGGAGTVEDIVEVFQEADVDAVSLASLLHYSYMKKNNKISEQGNMIFSQNYKNDTSQNLTINDIKKKLLEKNINIRK